MDEAQELSRKYLIDNLKWLEGYPPFVLILVTVVFYGVSPRREE